MLNYSSAFITDYKRRVAPLVKITSSDYDGRWTEDHTKLLNDIATIVWRHMKLHLVQPNLPLRIHVDADEEYCSVVIS